MKALTQEVKDDRWDIAEDHLRHKIDTIRRSWVFVDEATIAAVPEGGLVWASELGGRGELGPGAIVYEDPRIAKHPVLTKYLAAVNAVHGPLAFVPLTGSTRLPKHDPPFVSLTFLLSVTDMVMLFGWASGVGFGVHDKRAGGG